MTKVNQSLRQRIEDRLSPNSLLADQERLTGEDHPCALRTVRWIESNKWDLDVGDGRVVDISPWAERVRRVADELLSKSVADVETIEQHLLTFVIGDQDRARNFNKTGLTPLADIDHLSVGELIDVLDASARSPVENNPRLEVLGTTLADHIAPLIVAGANGWDVLCPEPYRKEGLAL